MNKKATEKRGDNENNYVKIPAGDHPRGNEIGVA